MQAEIWGRHTTCTKQRRFKPSKGSRAAQHSGRAREAPGIRLSHGEAGNDDRKRIREDVLRELRVTRGADFPGSMGGRLLVGQMSDRRFVAFLEIQHGIEAPALNGRHPIRYSELRESADGALA